MLMLKRLSMTLIGVIVCAFSVGMFNLAALGVDPFQCFAQGFYKIFSVHLQYGTFYAGLSLLMLIGILIWDKHYVGMATFINLFFFGYIVEYAYRFLTGVFPELSVMQRFGMLAGAVVIMCFGSAMYYTADLGVSVYDAISLILAQKKIEMAGKVMTFKVIRVVSDLVCVIIGTVFRKTPGIGTILTAFFMGPLISFFNHTMAEPFLYGRKKETKIK